MKKFTSVEEKPIPDSNNAGVLFNSDVFNIVQKDGWQFDSNCHDYVIGIVYLANHMEIVLRLEKIPSYKHRHNEFDRFVTVVSGTKEHGEGFEETLFREIYEETGLVISKAYKDFKLLTSVFITKSSSSKFHFYWVPLLDTDYRLERAPGDGSQIEAESVAFRIHISQLKTVKPSDLATCLAIEYAKNELAIS